MIKGIEPILVVWNPDLPRPLVVSFPDGTKFTALILAQHHHLVVTMVCFDPSNLSSNPTTR